MPLEPHTAMGTPSPSRVGSARTLTPHDVFDIGAADADIAQLMIGEARQFTHRLSIPEPGADLLRDHPEGDHFDSFSSAPRRLLDRKTFETGAHGGRAACSAKVSAKARSRRLSSPVFQNS